MASKYDPLYRHLKALPSSEHELTLSFEQIEAILGLTLPQSAYEWNAWWGADPKHAQAVAWLDAGFTASPDRISHRVRFHRSKDGAMSL